MRTTCNVISLLFFLTSMQLWAQSLDYVVEDYAMFKSQYSTSAYLPSFGVNEKVSSVDPAESKLESDFQIKIIRTAINSGSITGELFINGKFICHTLELPWRDNKYFVSSIPDGTYGAILRYDKNNERGIEYWRIELTGTEPRTFIQIHKGNTPSDIQGCVIVGNEVLNKQNKLVDSKTAFDKIKHLFYGTANPVATPSKSIKVSIDYNRSYTILRWKDDPAYYFRYAKDGTWKPCLPNFLE